MFPKTAVINWLSVLLKILQPALGDWFVLVFRSSLLVPFSWLCHLSNLEIDSCNWIILWNWFNCLLSLTRFLFQNTKKWGWKQRDRKRVYQNTHSSTDILNNFPMEDASFAQNCMFYLSAVSESHLIRLWFITQ